MSRHSCLLWGTGGIGKTQICLKFIEEISDRLSHVFWIDASSEESIAMSLRGISSIPAAQASFVDDSVESVLWWMSGIQEEWLIVFDNADVPPVYVVEKFIPLGNRGNILITSRNRSMGRIISFENIIEINEMEEVDAITLLLKASCLDASAEHVEVAKTIVTELGCMPLAVDQAGAYIEAGCPIDKYLQQYFLHRQTLMSDDTFRGASSYDRTVYGTWDLSFKEIQKRASGQSSAGDAQAAHAAILILQICAFYHHSNISKDIFRSAAEESREHVVDSEVDERLPLAKPLLDRTLLAMDNNGHWDEFIFGKGIAILLSFSLMKRDQSFEMLSVHPLVHCWSREQISKSEQQRMYEIGSIILCCAISRRLSSYDYGLRRLIFPHIKANESHASQMGLTKMYYDDKWNNFIFVIEEIGDWKHVEQLEVQVLEMSKKLLGAEHPDTLRSMGNLARTYADQGKLNEAEQLENQVLDMSKKLLGAEHPDTLRSQANLARTYGDQGKLNEAEQLEIQVLDIRKKLLGLEHPDTLISMGNLARTYVDQGKLNKAEKLEIQVLDMSKKLLGEEHPDTLTSMGNLARTYGDQGKLNEAEELEIQVLDMRKKLLGAEHPDTLRSRANLARTYGDQGKLNEAEWLEIQVLDIRKKLLGVEHPDTLTSMGNLARTYADQGKLNEAGELEIQVFDMRKKLLGAEHPDTLTSMANLAITYDGMGKLNEAEQLAIQVLDMRKKLLGAEHPDTLISMGNLASTYNGMGKLNEAEQLEIQVLDMSKKLLGAEHLDTLTSMENLASTYGDQGKLNEAEQLEIHVMDMRKKLLGAEHPDTLRSMAKLARTYGDQGELSEAERLEIQVFDGRKKVLGVEHPDTLISMANLASTYADQENLNEA
jgi:tetratricopeptide (TPR) repeat protein